MKEPGKVLIKIGWVLIILSVIVVIGTIQGPHHKDPSVEAFLDHPDSLSLAGTIGFLTGSNALSLFALGFGIYAVVKKNRKGKSLVIASIIALLFMSGIQLGLPSPESAEAKQCDCSLTTTSQSEFQVIFPHPVERKTVTCNGFETIAYESRGPCTSPYLRAEFINDINTVVYMKNSLRQILEDYARLAGLNMPEITECHDHLGMVGTYSGIKTAAGLSVKFYGKTVIGESSAINCIICETLEDFPSEDTVRFLGSLERK